MDIFFFIYSILFGLPLGVVQLPHGVDADDFRARIYLEAASQ